MQKLLPGLLTKAETELEVHCAGALVQHSIVKLQLSEQRVFGPSEIAGRNERVT